MAEHPEKKRKDPDQYRVQSNHKAAETNVDATYEYTSGNPTAESRKRKK